MIKLLSCANAKTQKGESLGYRTAILQLAHHTTSGAGNVCPWATPGCSACCLDDSGRARVFPKIKEARVKRTLYYFNDRDKFERQLEAEILLESIRAETEGLKFAVRVNGTSDIPRLAIKMARAHPSLIFYDYTKSIATLRRKDLPPNYHLTFSRSEKNEKQCLEAIALGYNVSVLFRNMKNLPKTFFGLPVISGETHDLRFLDPKGVIVALSPKGAAKRDRESGFVVEN